MFLVPEQGTSPLDVAGLALHDVEVMQTSTQATELGTLLRDARLDLRLSLRELRARTGGIPVTKLHGIEAGTRRPKNEVELLQIARALDVDGSDALTAAGMIPSTAVSQLIAAGLRGTFKGGTLSPRAEVALRQEHLRALVMDASPPSRLPVDMPNYLYSEFGYEKKESYAGTGFESKACYFVPPGETGGTLTALMAHYAGHLICETGGQDPAPRCDRSMDNKSEREAEFVAALLLVPPVLLRIEFERISHDYDLDDDDQMVEVMSEIASTFEVTFRMVAARLSADGHLGPVGFFG
jgi:hypothetical protein